MANALQDLMAHYRDTALLGSVAGRLGWDQQVMMPKGAAAQRAEEFGAIEAVLHGKRTDPRIGEWLSAIDRSALTEAETRSVELAEWQYTRATCLSEDLAVALARAEAQGVTAWEEARKSEDWAGFVPVLAEIVALKREEAAAKSQGEPLWDALAQDYEQGASAESIAALFKPLRKGLLDILSQVDQRPVEPFKVVFPQAEQLALCHDISKSFGYDFGHGRLDLSTHPFSAGGQADVRITTRVDEADPFNAIYSTIHEVGHATYEQRIDPSYAFTPLAGGVSMGVHESQSRLYENQLGRSRAYCEWLFAEMKQRFGDIGVKDAQAFYERVNHVHAGFIRTEADELHYNLHIMMRFDLERDMIEGRLDVADLEEAWNARFLQDFGEQPPKPTLGVMQDIHWPSGAFGYFPTYSLGNIYAGGLYKALRAAEPDLDSALERGDPSAATEWLRTHLQVFGRLRDPRRTIEYATQSVIDVNALIEHLRQKFLR